MAGSGKNCLRIIGGQWRGRKLNFANVDAIRPTPDRVRETLFNWLAPIINNANCLDLFSGSGALGFEALSRGAATVTMCDSHSKIITTLKEHAKLLKTNDAIILRTDALSFLKKNKKKYNLLFLDPPFNSGLLANCLEIIEANNCIADEGMVYVETHSKENLPLIPANWVLHRDNKAGDVAYYLFKTK